LSNRFTDKWGEKEDSQPFGEKIRKTIRSPGQMKPRLDRAINRLEGQIQRLDQTSNRLSERDRTIFAKIVDAYSKHDPQHANAFANELTEIRKTEKIVMNARLALEQITLRLKTVTELGDMVYALGPVIGVLGTVRTAITGVLPDAGRELDQIGMELSGIIGDAGQVTGLSVEFAAPSDDAQKILTEAASIVEQRTKDKLPELPALTDKPRAKT
jgi:division protein CdvB (Snf7/Vps24/ESCRT-III family)